MAVKKKNTRQKKICPFVDGECLETGCQLYHEEFSRCLIDLLVFNIYKLIMELQKYNNGKD